MPYIKVGDKTIVIPEYDQRKAYTSRKPPDRVWNGEKKKPKDIWDIDVTGFTKMPHLLLEKLAASKFTAPEYSVLLVILRKTIGWNKTNDSISVSQFVHLTGFDRRTIQKTLRKLQKREVIQKVSKSPGRRGYIWTVIRNNARNWPVRGRKNPSRNAAPIGGISEPPRGVKLILKRASNLCPTINKKKTLYIRKNGTPNYEEGRQ